VQAGIDAARSLGLTVDIGAMSNTLIGSPDEVLQALHAMEVAAIGAGATRIVVNVEAEEATASDVEFARALAEALGASYRISLVDSEGAVRAAFGVTGEQPSRTMIPLARSSGALVVEFEPDATGRRLPVRDDAAGQGSGSFTRVDQALTELIAHCEAEVGRSLADMSRAEKRQVVRFLDQRGAFALRKSVETVADALGVSRFTVYNYLESSRQDDRPGPLG
jgi:uncharacterized protein YqgV (UPF0045/DUF77 family)